MKKITLLLVTLFFSMVGYSQLTPTVEGFESTTGPTPLPSTTWSLSTGNWAVFDNGVGLNQRWGINSTVVTPPTPPLVYQGANSAYVNRENIGQGNTSEDYLSTPLVNIPTNGQLRFYTRTFSTGNQGTLYQIKVAPSTASQTDPAAYTLVQQWTEVDLTVNYNIYEEKLVDLSAYANQQVYVSFVKVYTQPLTVLDGDRWLIDNVSILERCLDPTNLAANGITQTSANLSWGNPSGATSWEIEVLPVAGTFTGVGVVYNGALPFNATATATGTPL
ncbi:MAG: choice-of-anchor J domain-containing protein, partial [Bacteroidia bacterium]